jgi:hypothetical protein
MTSTCPICGAPGTPSNLIDGLLMCSKDRAHAWAVPIPPIEERLADEIQKLIRYNHSSRALIFYDALNRINELQRKIEDQQIEISRLKGALDRSESCIAESEKEN